MFFLISGSKKKSEPATSTMCCGKKIAKSAFTFGIFFILFGLFLLFFWKDAQEKIVSEVSKKSLNHK